MAYKIAAASSDGQQIDLHFGHAEMFYIFEVQQDGTYVLLERREVPIQQEEETCGKEAAPGECGETKEAQGCSPKHGGQGGCGGGHSDTGIDTRTLLIEDCRCLLCKAIGPGAQRKLERRAITVFTVDLSVEKATEKIIRYYNKSDHHQSLRIVKEQNE